MADEELTTAEDLVREYAPDLVPQLNAFERVTMHFATFSLSILVTIPVLQMLGVYGLQPLTTIALASGATAGVGIAELIARKRISSERLHFRELTTSPARFNDVIVQRFTAEIERQRSNLLGANSQWARARAPLASAAQEAARSVAYWTQRLTMDDTNAVARQQFDTATRLRAKFDGALAELDARSHTLVSFFNECEARLAVLQSTKRDYEEAHRLEVLTEQADAVVSDASATLALIGQAFIDEATRVARALGGVERLGLINLAANVPVDHVELLADRIQENSEAERAALDRLVKGVAG